MTFIPPLPYLGILLLCTRSLSHGTETTDGGQMRNVILELARFETGDNGAGVGSEHAVGIEPASIISAEMGLAGGSRGLRVDGRERMSDHKPVWNLDGHGEHIGVRKDDGRFIVQRRKVDIN
ncbi:hypothetical protein IW262DRAFT_1299240 [Armillaria fumosa]|nr:hypothetical protein IW262DRAFT_1299240 [Armillaria fumosa]